MLGDLLQGAVWLALIGMVAIVVVIALVFAALRRAAGRDTTPDAEESGTQREDNYQTMTGTTMQRSDEMGPYAGREVLGSTEAASTAMDGTPTIRTHETDDRERYQ